MKSHRVLTWMFGVRENCIRNHSCNITPGASRLWIPILRPFSSRVSTDVLEQQSKDKVTVEKQYQQVMRKVPQSVVIVTAAEHNILQNRWSKRGMTCTSFTSVSHDPPIISFCVKSHSRMHDIFLKTQHFAVHVLAKNQIKYGVHFSKPITDEICQFQNIPHEQNEMGVPIIPGCMSILECKAHSVHTVGDHHVWYGDVIDASITEDKVNPLLYWIRKFRTVGDEIFLQAFEDATLPFEDWTHEAHLRMAWNYITELGKEEAIPKIKEGIQHFNEQNKDRVKFGYHETITLFYISVVADAINKDPPTSTFEDFILQHRILLDKNVISQYYTWDRLYSDIARHSFVTPDLQPLPC